MALSLAELDVSSSLALLAIQRGYVKPIIGNKNEFVVKGGRHPVVDMLQPNSFVSNDLDLGEKNVWIVTGPNMGGKCSDRISFIERSPIQTNKCFKCYLNANRIYSQILDYYWFSVDLFVPYMARKYVDVQLHNYRYPIKTFL